jgi:hypothetical protein
MAKTAARARGQHDSVDGVDTHCSDTLTWHHTGNAGNVPQIPLFFGSAVISGVIGAMGKEIFMKFSTRFLMLAALLAAGHFAVPAALAQAQSPLQGSPAPVVSDQRIEATAAALERVASLQQTYRQRLSEATEQADKERIVAEANGALTKAVTDQGLSVEEYASILQAAQNDPALRGKIIERIHQPGK